MPEDTNLFVRFEDPVALRKSLLEASRNVLVSLQNFERFKSFRTEKSKLMKELNDQITEVNSLFNQLKKEMPKSAAAKMKKIAQPVKKPVSAKPDELEDIESQLSNIEGMLGDLS
jgi:hypothetical protein